VKHSKWSYRFLVLLAGAACALPATAQMSPRDAPGFYAGASIGMNNDNETAWRLLGGYNVNRNFGVELGYHDTGDANLRGAPVGTHLWELVGVLKLPLDERFGFYGKVGGYRAKVSGEGMDETTTDVTFAVGAQYELNPDVAVRGEWQRYSDMGGGPFPSADMDLYTIGILYRFH
jgi:OOP family OmpA-OmpF porin